MKRLLFLLCFFGVSPLACAEETLSVCFNYGCLNQAEVTFSQTQFDEVQALLADAADALHERVLARLRELRTGGLIAPMALGNECILEPNCLKYV